MKKIERLNIREYNGLQFALTRTERGYLNPKEKLGFPEFFLDKAGHGSITCVGRIRFYEDEDEEGKFEYVYFYPNEHNGFDIEFLSKLQLYLQDVKDHYKELIKYR